MANIKTVNIKVEGKKWDNAIEEALNKKIANAKVDGFRKGHVPKDIYIKKYGKESLYMDAADICAEIAYRQMIEENQELEIVAQPDMNVTSISEKGIEFEFKLTLKPEVKLGKYKGLDVKKEKAKVNEQEINDAISKMQERYSETVIKEGKVEQGSIAIIDFEGFKDGIPFEGGKSENYSLEIGSNSFIPGFEDQLIGMEKGEEREINVKFPDDYHAEDLKGQPVVFKVKVHEIKEIKIPELDADFFEDLGMEGVDSEETLESHVKETIIARKDMEIENKYMDDLLKAAATTTEVDIPDVMIEEELHRMIHQYEDSLKMQGITLKQFYQFTNSNEEQLKGQMREEAINRITYRLMLEEIAKQEKIEVSDETAEKELEELSKKYEMEKEEFVKQFGGLEMIKYDLKMRQALEVLKK